MIEIGWLIISLTCNANFLECAKKAEELENKYCLVKSLEENYSGGSYRITLACSDEAVQLLLDEGKKDD
jgi:hypothetical protein